MNLPNGKPHPFIKTPANPNAPWTQENWLLHPDVPKMVRLAVSRQKRMFDAYADIDEESLYADVMGELVKAKYDPTKRQPHSHAYQVAWCRLIDISRRRANELRGQQRFRESGQVKSDEVDEEMTLEEIAVSLYEAVCRTFRQKGVPIRLPHCGRPYPDRAQRMALHLLQQRMGWKDREAAENLKESPEVLQAIGVTQTLSHVFFWRASESVTQLKKIFATPAPSAPAA